MSDSTIDRYNRKATQYEQRWQKYLNYTHQLLLKKIEITESDIILDSSGGTGLFAKKLIDQDYSFEHLVINDPSNQMLAIARQRFSNHKKITFTNDKVEQLSYPENHFDKIICLNAFHFYQAQQEVLNQFFKILLPEGSLYILDWNREGFFKVINKFINCTNSEYIDTRSLPELKEMMATSGFELPAYQSYSWRYWKFLFVEGYKSNP